MTHNPEQLAAAYLGGMPATQHRRFEDHLLACDSCWREVSLGRAGRELAESARDKAPAGLREDIRAIVTAAATEHKTATGPRRWHRSLAAAGTLAVLLIFIVGLGGWQPWHRSTPDAETNAARPTTTLNVAVAGFRDDRLPGTAIPAQQAPDLSTLGLHLVSAAAGGIDGVDVTVFAYRTGNGTRLDLYRSTQPIPEANEAQELDSDDHAWRTNIDGIAVICGGDNHTELVISTDPRLVHQAATVLSIT